MSTSQPWAGGPAKDWSPSRGGGGWLDRARVGGASAPGSPQGGGFSFASSSLAFLLSPFPPLPLPFLPPSSLSCLLSVSLLFLSLLLPPSSSSRSSSSPTFLPFLPPRFPSPVPPFLRLPSLLSPVSRPSFSPTTRSPLPVSPFLSFYLSLSPWLRAIGLCSASVMCNTLETKKRTQPLPIVHAHHPRQRIL